MLAGGSPASNPPMRLRILVDEKSIASFGLRKVQRQEPKEYRDAIRALRINPANGFARLEKMDAVHKAEMFDRPERVSEAYRSAKGDVLVVCPTHEEIRRVTEAIRSDLTSDGKLGKETTLNRLEPQNWTEAQKRDMRNYEPGQVLVFHKGTKYAHKHEAMTVLSQEDGILHVRSAQGRETTITKKQAKCFGVFAAKDIGVAPGDWLSIQANMKDGPYQFAVSFRQGCVKGDIGAGIRIIRAGMGGPCAWCTWRGWSPCRLRRHNRTCG